MKYGSFSGRDRAMVNAVLRKLIAGLALSLALAGCRDPADPCAARYACEVQGVDLYIPELTVIGTRTDLATGLDVVDLDSVRVEFTVRNRGDTASAPVTLVLEHRLRFTADSIEIPGLGPGRSHTARRLLPPYGDHAFLFPPAGDTIRISARLLAEDADTTNNGVESAPVGIGPEPDLDDPQCQRVSGNALEWPPPAVLLAARRQALASRIGTGVIVLAAGTPNEDPYNEGYRGDNSLFYLAGLDLPESRLVVVVDDFQVLSTVLYLPQGATSANGPVQAADVTGATRVRCARSFSQDLRLMLPSSGLPLELHTGNAAVDDTVIVSLRALPELLTFVRNKHLNALRVVKDTAEIARLRTAATITAESVRDAVTVIGTGDNEADVEAAILAGFAVRGAPHASFHSIVASGANALSFHYSDNQRTFTGDELVLIDVGAEYGRYAGDVTRTFPVSGRFSERQRALYELVLGAADTAIASVRPGTNRETLEWLARAYMQAHSDTLCGKKTCDSLFGHSISHLLGLNVHDVGGYGLLEPGMVITIEPGIYLEAEGIGIRIEDDVLVTETGCEVLSGTGPRTVAEIEALFAARR